MPKIRRYKNYDFEFDREEQDNEGIDGSEFLHGESWLSTKAVISRIPDAILRRSLKYYREIVGTLETEIRQRDSGIKPSISEYSHTNAEAQWQDSRLLWIPESDRKKHSRQALRVPARKDKDRKTVQGFIKRSLKSLNSIQKTQLIEEWSLIFKTLNKELNYGNVEKCKKEDR